jgi:phage protein D
MTDKVKNAVCWISVDGRDVTSNFDPHLISMTIRLTDGGKSDSLEIILDDKDGRLQLPREGADIRATLSWSNGAGGAVEFTGKTDEPESEGSRGGGMVLSITAHAVDLKGKPKAKRQRHKDQATFGDVAKEWGEAADLDVKVGGELASIKREFWDMRNESYMAWGARLARELGATFKIMGRKAVFVARNSDNSASGKALIPVRAVYGDNIINWRLSPIQDRARYRKSIVRWYDSKKAEWEKQEVDIGDASALVDLIETKKRADRDLAKDQAQSNAAESKRGKGGGSITIDGEPAAQAQSLCVVSGVRAGIDGEYRIATASHAYSRNGGWVTVCQLEQPQGGAGTDGRQAAG